MLDTPEVAIDISDNSTKLQQKWHAMKNSQGLDRQPKPHFVDEYEQQKQKTMSEYRQQVVEASSVDDRKKLREIFQTLANVQENSSAELLLFQEGLSDQQRLRVAVEHINTLGFINTIDLISSRIDEDISDDERLQLENLYKTLQGDKATEIYQELSEIYEKIDFGKYEINTSKLTESETDRAEALVDSKDDWILDIGAGTGRHALTLSSRGYTNVVAFEYEQKHINIMREADPSLRVVQGDWHNIEDAFVENGLVHYTDKPSATLIERVKMKAAYCYGRTFAHNRTPESMLSAFDQVTQVLEPDGKFAFDMPAIDWGIYKQRIDEMSSNLESLGIDSSVAKRIFDGPNNTDKFNRMVLDQEQTQAMATLLGYKLTSQESEVIEDDIKNIYYVLEKDPKFNFMNLDQNTLQNALVSLGLYDADTNYDLYVKEWGMTLGQAVAYAGNLGVGNPHIKNLNESGMPPEVTVTRSTSESGGLTFEASGLNQRDYAIALAAKKKGVDAYNSFLSALENARSNAQRREILNGFITID